jgi:hypothetical protein
VSTTNAQVDVEQWGRVDPDTIVAVNDLVTDAFRILDSAATSWGAGRRSAMEDMLERVRALMRELAWLAGDRDGVDDPGHALLLRRRAELLAGVTSLERDSGQRQAREHSR